MFNRSEWTQRNGNHDFQLITPFLIFAFHLYEYQRFGRKADTPDMQSAAKFFFSKSTFAVAGVSSNPAKFGYKIFAWYLGHNLHAVPLNPTTSSVTVSQKEYETLSSPSKLADPKNTSLSIITPPSVTAQLLKEAKDAGIQAVWLQPGTFTDKELDFAIKEFPGGALGGFSEGTIGGEGWCVLVDGDAALSAVARDRKL